MTVLRAARIFSTVLAVIGLPAAAFAQSTLLQGGPVAPGHVPMYVNSYSQQPIVQDSGSAAGGPPGTGLSELGLTVRGTGTAPFANAGTGPNGENFCDYDAPTTNATGYHVLCISPNALGGGLISYGAFGGASQLPFSIAVNGVTETFPFIVTFGGQQVGSIIAGTNITGSMSGSALTLALSSSPALSGIPTAPTAAVTTDNTQIATTAFDYSLMASPPSAGYGSTTAEPVNATNLAASGTVSGTGFTNYFAAPPALGSTTPNTVNASTLTTTSPIAIAFGGTNANTVPGALSNLLGNPGAGSFGIACTSANNCTTAPSGTFTPDNVDITGGSINGTIIGGTAPTSGSFTTVSATSGSFTTVSATTPISVSSGGTGTTTAADALSNLIGNPIAGTYSVVCASTSNCTAIASAPGVVGDTRNLVMFVTAASSTATMTANEINVQATLAGASYQLTNFSQTINLATTGAGGMDTGSPPVSGAVGIYAIFNPTTGVSALLATNATTAAAPSIYSGTHMPAGFTASALVSVWITNSSGQLIYGNQFDRRVGISAINVLSTSAAPLDPTPIFLPQIPLNAKTVKGFSSFQSTTSTSVISLAVGGASPFIEASASQGIGQQALYFDISMATPEEIFWQAQNSAGSFGANIDITGYTF
jgi:hypothetical protein